MKQRTGFFVYLGILSVISGYLLSKASLIGRAGMSLFYREYNFLKKWWKGALLVAAALFALFFLHGYLAKKYPAQKARLLHGIGCALAITGLYFSYNDFRHTLSHHLLGERFHLGVYLFWLGWISICVFYLVQPKTISLSEPPVRFDEEHNDTGNYR